MLLVVYSYIANLLPRLTNEPRSVLKMRASPHPVGYYGDAGTVPVTTKLAE